MAFDVASIRGLYTSLGDGWTYLNAHDTPQIPERVSAAVSRSFRLSASVALPEPGAGTHSREQLGRPEGESYVQQARSAVADLVGAAPGRVVLGPSLPALYASLAVALKPLFRRDSSLVLNGVDRPELTGALARIDAPTKYAQADLATGDLPAWQFGDLVDGATRLVSVPAAHAELGTIIGVGDVVERVRERSRAWVLVDVSAYAPYKPITFDAWGADILAIDLAELGGPQLGALVFRDEAMFGRLDASALDMRVSTGLAGGVPAVVEHYASLVEGAQGRPTRRNRLTHSMGETATYFNRLRDDLDTFLGTLPAVHIVGVSGEAAEDAAIERIPRLMFGVRGVPSTMVHQRLFAHGIVSTMARPSQLISDMGVAEMGGAVTVGLAPFNTETDIEQLIRTVASLA
ncbi:cysteine desulfurase [Corynebacterium sp. NML 120412]|uniref:aminotransferase class V-fold PLP-dependent enzyme n=1 Tax=Corynebacterium sp. NML 120412 TaxID=2029401 RepID=UPI000BAA82D8|nr:aminotransferase class V-fold PLP-dependent enzyme [Corynebacterium sp. NML 120412]PAT14085.1 cysteine desulfurase [Corynebacterium sp. NML 120412]